MPTQDSAKLTEIAVNLFGIATAKWQNDPTQRKAAWFLYVELITRVAVQPLRRLWFAAGSSHLTLSLELHTNYRMTTNEHD